MESPAPTLDEALAESLCFRRDHGILGSLCEPELYGGARLDLDRFSRSRVSPDPRRTLRLHELAKSWDRKLPQLFSLSGRGLDEQIQEACNLLWRNLHLLGHEADQHGLRHLDGRCLTAGRSFGGCCFFRYDLRGNSRLLRCCLFGRQ